MHTHKRITDNKDKTNDIRTQKYNTNVTSDWTASF